MQKFLLEWSDNYKQMLSQIPLFDSSISKNFTTQQKQYFAKIFYHARGHFHDFLWYVANHATDKETKDIVIENISEEFNSSAASHEQLYIAFAESLDVDISNELVNQENYLPWIKAFNKKHLQWLHTHDAEERFAAFSAYELLDNIDYTSLLNLVKSFDISNKGQIFFKIHAKVMHFDTTSSKLQAIWNSNPQKVKIAFDFIGDHQLAMWSSMHNAINNYKENLYSIKHYDSSQNLATAEYA